MARGHNGVYAALALGGGTFGPGQRVSLAFSDAGGFGAMAYAPSFQVADLNGDGRGDLIERGWEGLWVQLAQPNGTFAAAQVWAPEFGDAEGWSDAGVAGSFRVGDVNGDGRADVLAKSSAGVRVALSAF